MPGKDNTRKDPTAGERRRALLQLPQENILYFLEKTAPRLAPWQREVLRIVRQIAQYFYPQSQTKLMNEGCATYVHYRIMNRLHDKGLLTDGAMVEFLRSHTNVVFQPEFDDPRYSGINPYALGFAMMQDIERICNEPTAEDQQWFPAIAGTGDEMAVLRDVWANYRDESFILQFLSPRLIRQFGLFHVLDDAEDPHLTVQAIHDERGYRKIQRALARQYDIAWTLPDIQVVDVDLDGDRKLDAAPPRAQSCTARGEGCPRRPAAPGRPVGLRRRHEGDRSHRRAGHEGTRRHPPPRDRAPDLTAAARRPPPIATVHRRGCA